MLEKGKEILLTIKRLGINGEGIGYYKRKAVFVEGAIPPEEVIVKITEEKEKYAKGELKEVRLRAKERTKPFCKFFDQCGGCQIQHINYNEQLLLKKEMLIQAFERYTNEDIKSIKFNLVEGMDKPTHYRYKSQMPVRNGDDGLISGFYAPETNQLIDIDNCPVHTDLINAINEQILRTCEQYNIQAFDPTTMYGLLRYVVVRQSHLNDDVQVTLVVTIFNKALYSAAKDIIKLPHVKSVAISKNKDVKNVEIFGNDVEILAGEKTIKEGIDDIVYELMPKAFYQLNPSQATKMYKHVKSQIKDIEKKTIIDAYCGAGAMTLYLAKYAKEVVGIDLSKDSIDSANQNAKLNNMDNVKFKLGKVESVLPRLYDQSKVPDVLVVDPPRKGLDYKTIDVLNRKVLDTLVYVSCNPSTLAKNIKALSRKYKVVSVTPFDMFPHTSHIESVTILRGIK